jgi:regulator of PEP synthase PpsR (kinase-PPPase family)
LQDQEANMNHTGSTTSHYDIVILGGGYAGLMAALRLSAGHTLPRGRVGAQHVLNAEYFKRIDALNYAMLHDDGQHVEGFDEADVVLVGMSRTSKTPTSIYLANRGIRTANVPLVQGIPPPRLRAIAGANAAGL